MAARWLSAVRELIAVWYRRDRVRVSPATGRLLGLQVGDQFVFQTDAYVVQARLPGCQDSHDLLYQLQGSSGPATLRVVRHADGWAVDAVLITPDAEIEIFDDDVVLRRG